MIFVDIKGYSVRHLRRDEGVILDFQLLKNENILTAALGSYFSTNNLNVKT